MEMTAHAPLKRMPRRGLKDAAAGPAPHLAPVRSDRTTIHEMIVPAEVRPGDPIAARVGFAGAREREDSQVWRISPLGVELVRPPALAGARPGTTIDLTLRLGDDVTRFSGLPISAAWQERGRELIAARWSPGVESRSEAACRRDGARWRCDADYSPTGIAKNALRFGDFVHYRVAEISRTGMRLRTSLRNKFLVPGASLESTCTFPTLGELPLDLRVVHTAVERHGEKDVLSLGVTWSSAAGRSAETIGQYLLQFGPGVTPDRLRSDGFRVRSMSRAFDFGWVQGERDYEEVLALRRLAYVHARKVSSDVKDEAMGDDGDARSRIVVARHRGRIVGTVRVMFPRTDADRLKHEDYCALPATLPPRGAIVEVSKACTHPDFRGSDLFFSLLKHAALVTMQARRRYILMSCTDALLPLYQKIGVRRLGVGYFHPTMKLQHHVMVADVAALAAGQGMNPIVWNLAIGPELWAYARRCGCFPGSAWRSARVRLALLFAPLASVAALWLRHAAARRGTR